MKIIVAIIGLLWGEGIASAQEYNPQDFLPLSVGNSWTYEHMYQDITDNVNDAFFAEVTISITHAEEISGNTYYVFSDMPYEWPPAPPFFLAGKKVRFSEDGKLLMRGETEDEWLYWFQPDSVGTYTAIGFEGGVQVGRTCDQYFGPVSECIFRFPFGAKSSGRINNAGFIEYYGLDICEIREMDGDQPTVANFLTAHHAVIDGMPRRKGEVPQRTVVSPEAWGLVKSSSGKRRSP